LTYHNIYAQLKQKNQWFIDAAKDACMDLDEELLEDSMINGSDNRDRMRAKEAIQAKSSLRQLLSKPMRKQNFGKFLSGAGMAASVKVEAQVTPFVVPTSKKGDKKRVKQTNKKRKNVVMLDSKNGSNLKKIRS